jgi:hypothetical protein
MSGPFSLFLETYTPHIKGTKVGEISASIREAHLTGHQLHRSADARSLLGPHDR